MHRTARGALAAGARGHRSGLPRRSADLDTVGSIIAEFGAVDPESMGFRYAHDRKRQVNLPAGLERVNVGHVAT